jgi:protein associated with RNAse G/E
MEVYIMRKEIVIQAFKHPNIAHYEWCGDLLEVTDEYLLLHCKYGRELKHFSKDKVFIMKNESIELFSFKHWFTASCSVENNKISSYYCNIAQPSLFNGNSVSFVDLDLDMIKKENSDWKVVDEDEFIINSNKYNYGINLIEETERQLKLFQNRISNSLFPFDGSFDNYINQYIK